MLTRAVRLGDDIDDFCVKCKRVMNHSVVSILNDGPAKVRCRTCHSDHDFRNEQPPPPKVDPRKAALFNEVLGNVSGLPADAASPAKPVDGSEKPVDGNAKPIDGGAEPDDESGPIEAEADEKAAPVKAASKKAAKAKTPAKVAKKAKA